MTKKGVTFSDRRPQRKIREHPPVVCSCSLLCHPYLYPYSLGGIFIARVTLMDHQALLYPLSSSAITKHIRTKVPVSYYSPCRSCVVILVLYKPFGGLLGQRLKGFIMKKTESDTHTNWVGVCSTQWVFDIYSGVGSHYKWAREMRSRLISIKTNCTYIFFSLFDTV